MNKIIIALASVLLALTAAAQQPAQPAAEIPATLLIQNVTLIDGTGANPRGHATLLVRDGKIAEILSADTAPVADLAVNGTGLFAIPGLIDAHVHLSPAPLDRRTSELRRTLDGGVTTVYDLAGDTRETGDLARAVLAGDLEGPSIYYAALMSGPAFFTDPRVIESSVGFRPGEAPWAQAITGETDLVKAVAAARGTGATALKLYAALDAVTVKRIAEEARRQGLQLVAHACVFPAKPSDMVAAGVDMLAHAPYLVWEGMPPSTDFTRRAVGDFAHVATDSPEIVRLLESMRDHDVALNPTLYIFAAQQSGNEVSRARVQWGNGVTRRAAALGVRIVAGTDNMIDLQRDPLPLLHRELETLVSGAGLTPMQALVSATRNAAHAIGVEQERGTIEAGKVADIVLLEANPAEDIRNTSKIRMVIKQGRLVFDSKLRPRQ